MSFPGGMMEAEYGYDLDGNKVSRSDALSRTSHYGYNLRGSFFGNWRRLPKRKGNSFTGRGQSPWKAKKYAYDQGWRENEPRKNNAQETPCKEN